MKQLLRKKRETSHQVSFVCEPKFHLEFTRLIPGPTLECAKKFNKVNKVLKSASFKLSGKESMVEG